MDEVRVRSAIRDTDLVWLFDGRVLEVFGMSADAAERMIVRGFFERVVAQIDSEPIKARVLEALAARIGSAEEAAA